MALNDPAPDDAHAGEHHFHRMRNDVLSAAALKAGDPDGWHIEARTFVNTNCHVELFSGIPERLVIRGMEHLFVLRVWPDKAGAHAELLAGKVHLLNCQLQSTRLGWLTDGVP